MGIDLAQYEKKAFWKFFITYFISVALLIIVAGHFYFTQSKNHLLKEEEFALIEYARHIKMKEPLDQFHNKGFKHRYLYLKKYVDIRNFFEGEQTFSKLIPTKQQGYYLEVFKSKQHYITEIKKVVFIVITIQIALLFVFAWISYVLAKNALQPLQNSIEMLDKFIKDLIHDLNTPMTSIRLNVKLLQKERSSKPLVRLEQSVRSIDELYKNLTLLLEEKTFQFSEIDICKIITELVEQYKVLYPKLEFSLECHHFVVRTNPAAMKQILQNLLNNASKYTKDGGYVKIYTSENKLYIANNGKSIEEPQKIFQRNFTTGQGSGLGLDIVKRLSKAMGIQVRLKSDPQEVIFVLDFKKDK